MRRDMKNIFLLLSTFALVCCFTGSLFAADYSLEDLKFANGLTSYVKIDEGSSFVSGSINGLKHDLNHPDPIGHTYTPGTPWFDKNFNPATQVIKEASLDLYMRDTFSITDPDDPLYGSNDEYARLFIEGIQCAEDYEIDNGGYAGWSKYTYTLTPSMIDLLDQDGVLDFTLTSRQNDFFFWKSVLNVTVGDKPTNPPVPEPATVLLFGFGLFGLAAFRKKMK